MLQEGAKASARRKLEFLNGISLVAGSVMSKKAGTELEKLLKSLRDIANGD